MKFSITGQQADTYKVRDGILSYRRYFKKVEQPLTEGWEAILDNGGDVTRRTTLTRVAMVGIAAPLMKKKKDTRFCTVTISGPDTFITINIDPESKRAIQGASAFVNQFNGYVSSLQAVSR